MKNRLRVLLTILLTFAAAEARAVTHNWTNNGKYTITILTGAVTVAAINLDAASGTQTLLHGTGNNLNVTNAATVRANGTLSITDGGLPGRVFVQSGGQPELAGTATKGMYQLTLINQGTVTWSGGNLQGGSTPTTVVSNGGLWQITGNYVFNNPFGGPPMTWTNTGTLRESAGSSPSQNNEFSFVNQTSGLIQSDNGILQWSAPTTNSAGTLRVNGGAIQ